MEPCLHLVPSNPAHSLIDGVERGVRLSKVAAPASACAGGKSQNDLRIVGKCLEAPGR